MIKGRKKVRKLKVVQEQNDDGQNSDKEWVECNTDDEAEQQTIKLEELLDDLKLSDDEKEQNIQEQNQLVKENEETVDAFINQMA